MPKMYTNKNPRLALPTQASDVAKACTSSYDDYVAQRTKKSDVNFPELQDLTTQFRTHITDRIGQINANVEMGDYFVIPVQEIKDMLDQNKNATFIHISNALRKVDNSSKLIPVTIITPVAKTSTSLGEAYLVCQDPESVYIESYPCPPDPQCPKAALEGTIFKSGTPLNNFKSLF